ncbi:uncharacterized protein [Ptychodera flava]|uniref:uncharacterized protein isoform X3 n=1 Tax=Ptychodera flava TaxID=63121 RepID=UPI00396A81CA
MKISALLIFGVICCFQKATASSLGRRAAEEHHSTLIGVTTDNEMIVLDEDGEWSDPIENSCCVLSVTVQPGGIVIGVGTDNQLYEWKSKGGKWSWVGPVEDSCCVMAIRTGTRGRLIGISTDNKLMTRAQLKGATWRRQPKGCCFLSVETLGNGMMYAVNKNYKVRSKIDIYTGNWSPVKITGAEVKDCLYLDDNNISLGLSIDGCQIYQLEYETMTWLPYLSLGDKCLISYGEGEDPVIELHGH